MKLLVIKLLLLVFLVAGCQNLQESIIVGAISVKSEQNSEISVNSSQNAALNPQPSSETSVSTQHSSDEKSKLTSTIVSKPENYSVNNTNGQSKIQSETRTLLAPKRSTTSTAKNSEISSADWTEKLRRANLILIAPDRSNISEDVRLELLLSLEKSLDEIRRDITETGVQHSDVIVVSRIVEVTVTAPDFDVKPITASRQLLSSSTTNSWKWTLRAKRSGVHSIDVSVTAVIEIAGTRTEHHIKTFNKSVDIDITPQQYASEWFSKYWQWLASTVVLPLLLWLRKSRSSNKRNCT